MGKSGEEGKGTRQRQKVEDRHCETEGRLRDVSVTADCADIDPSLVLSLQETGSQRGAGGSGDTERL